MSFLDVSIALNNIQIYILMGHNMWRNKHVRNLSRVRSPGGDMEEIFL